MNEFAEEVAAMALLRLCRPDGGGLADLPRYFQWLGPELVLVRYAAEVEDAQYLPAGRLPAVILLPPGVAPEEVGHEAGHLAHRHGLAAYLRTAGNLALYQDRTRYERVRRREDREATDFSLAFLLPAFRVQQCRTEGELRELAERAGLSFEVAQRRKLDLRRDTFLLSMPPKWSAWWHFELWLRKSLGRIDVRPREGGEVRYELPLNPNRELELQIWERSVDLMALSPDEWERRHRDYATGDEPQRVTLDLRRAIVWLDRWLESTREKEEAA